MALEDQYGARGLGRTSAMVVDLSPTYAFLKQNREETRKKNAERQAKRAVKQAAVGSLLDDLKAGGRQKHIQHFQDEKKHITDFYYQGLQEGGTDFFIDNPKKAQELRDMVSKYESDMKWSEGSAKEVEAMLERSHKSPSEVNMESVKEFKNWYDSDFETQRTTGMKYIEDAEKNLTDLVTTNLKDEIEGQIAAISTPTKKDPITGEYAQITTKGATDKSLMAIADRVVSNESSEVGQKALKDAMSEINQDLIPQYLSDENGEQVVNPEFLSAAKEIAVRNVFDINKQIAGKSDYTKALRGGTTGGTTKGVPSATAVQDKDRGWVTGVGGTSNEHAASSGTAHGQKVIQIKHPIIVNPDGSYERVPPGTEGAIEAYSWIDKSGNLVKASDVSEDKKFKTHPVKTQVGITDGEVVKLDKAPEYYYDDSGKKKSIPDPNVVEDARIVEYKKVDVNEDSKGNLIFEDDKRYNKDNKVEIEVVTVKTKAGTYNFPYTDDLKESFSETDALIKEKGGGKSTKQSIPGF